MRRSLSLLISLLGLTLTAFPQQGERRPGSVASHLFRVSRDSVSGKSRIGFIDKSGKLVIGFDRLPAGTEGADYFYEGRARIWLRQDGAEKLSYLTGYIDETGELVIAPRFQTALVLAPRFQTSRDFSEGLAYVETEAFRGFIDRDGKLVIRIDNLGGELRATEFHEARAAVVTKDGKWGYIDRAGSLVIKPQYRYAADFSEGLAAVVVNGTYGFINKKGEMVIAPRFEPRQGDYTWEGIANTSRFSEGLACVRLGDLYGYINKKGRFVIPAQFHNAQDFSEGKAWVVSGDRKKIGWIDKSGQWVITDVNGESFSHTQSGLAYSRSAISWMRFSEGLAPFSVLVYPGAYSRWGYMDQRGNEVIKPRFAYVHPFDGGLAWVTSDEAYGYIDKGGRFVWRK